MAASDWRVELVKTYPDLFHPVGDPPAAEGWPEVGEGWRDLLERACVRIRAEVDGGIFHATQIKKKYATLGFYFNGTLSPEAEAKVEEAIDLAEARSACTCDVCGEPGRLYDTSRLMTRCAEHAEARSPVGFQPEFENVHVKEQWVGNQRIVRRRRYDRETDSFVDVDPGSLGIEEE
ncbi:hypothetical protein [Bradyrhizobium sp. USDA 10063]